MPSEHHFVCLFKNNNKLFNLDINKCYYFDDISGYIQEIDDNLINYIMNHNSLSLFIYIKD